MIVRYCELGTVGITGVVHETGRSTHQHPITHVALALFPPIEVEKVVVCFWAAFLATLVGFFACDNLAPVSIDELAFL